MTNASLNSRYSRWLYLFWLYTLIVIAWGAWVRISHSGNGCGDHWPLCNGEFMPSFENKKTLVEYTHRLMSGLYGLCVVGIFFFFRKNSDSQVRKLSLALLIFMIIEALLGALLVKQNLVTVNDSIFRLVAMSLHQLNSFLLTGTTYLLFLSSLYSLRIKVTRLNMIFLVLAISGAIASLAATLFPSTSLWEGILKDFSSDSHLFIKLRVVHPILAVLSVAGTIYWLQTQNSKENSKSTNILTLKLLFAGTVGFITLITLSPIWLKITHLMIAHFVWAAILNFQLKNNSE